MSPGALVTAGVEFFAALGCALVGLAAWRRRPAPASAAFATLAGSIAWWCFWGAAGQLTGDLPARREAWRASGLADDPYARAFWEQLGRVVPTPKVPEWEAIATKVQEYAERVARGATTIDDALAGLDRDVDRMLEKRRYLLARK